MKDKFDMHKRFELKAGLNNSLYIIDNKEKAEISVQQLLNQANDYYADSVILENKILGYDLLNGGFSLLQSFQKDVLSLMAHCDANMTNAIFEKKFAQYLGNDTFIRIEIRGKK